jgi:hypothetical protein
MPTPDKRNFRICEWGPRTADPDTLYIRLDDDVVFMEEGALRDLLAFRVAHPEPFLVYPAIINNGVMIHLFQRRGVLPRELPFCEYAAFGNGFRETAFAEAVHRQFLAALQSQKLDSWRFGNWWLHCYERVCVNCISWFGKDFAEFGGKVGWDEEKFLSCDKPAMLKRPNVIYGNPIVAHFSYSHQNKRLDQTDLLSAYREICDQMTPPLDIGRNRGSPLTSASAGPQNPPPSAPGKSKMKLVYASSPSHDRLRDEFFLSTLCESWDPVEVRFDAAGTGNYGSSGWKQTVVQRFVHFARIARENADQIVIFCDTDIQWLKPIQPLIQDLLVDFEILFQREWHGRSEVNTGFIAARCTPRVIALLEHIGQTANSVISDQTLMNQLVANGQVPCPFGYLPNIFANDHLLPFVPLDEAVIYHSVRSLSTYSQEATVEVKARQHQLVQAKVRTPNGNRTLPANLRHLIGTDLVFGRFYGARPMNFEPLGVIQLRPDGRIAGYQNPNECTWKAKDGALSFFHADGSLTSTFDRAIEVDGTKVAIGPCFTHPLIHFLFPYEPLGPQAQILYVVLAQSTQNAFREKINAQFLAQGINRNALQIVSVAASGTHAIHTNGLCKLVEQNLPFEFVYLIYENSKRDINFRMVAESQPARPTVDMCVTTGSRRLPEGLYRMGFLRDNLQALAASVVSSSGVGENKLVDRAWVVSQFLHWQSK